MSLHNDSDPAACASNAMATYSRKSGLVLPHPPLLLPRQSDLSDLSETVRPLTSLRPRSPFGTILRPTCATVKYVCRQANR